MRKRFLFASAFATLAFAAPAAANPFTDVASLAGPAGQINLGGATRTDPARIDWGVAGGIANPQLRGRQFMFDVGGVNARVELEYYDDAINHNLLGVETDPSHAGVAGGLATFPVALGPLIADSAHVHANLYVNGALVDTAFCTMGQATC